MAKSSQHRVFVLKCVFTLFSLLACSLQAGGLCWDAKEVSAFTRWESNREEREDGQLTPETALSSTVEFI